ncbi:MAG: sulfatase-like hydrolase/transferase [Proteobacteria bacterium]|nr:sulfatase-like hydrolase/transferase [Pseudomonadota bacterium]MBI3497227.1 sulfatase-like hydrolase/transferase [Pseudomonadota bacterium]
MGRPNFLLIMTDQQRADHLGCYGNPMVKTPHIDALARRGLTFDRFYVATPICMPNRASLMTGRMPSSHGVRHNGIPLSLRATTFAELLRADGYRTAMVGKSHLQNMWERPPLVPDARDSALKRPPPRLDEASAPEPGRYDQEFAQRWRKDPRRHMDLPYYGFEAVDLAIEHGDQVDGHYTQWLAERHPHPEELRGAENALPAPDIVVPQAWRTRIPEALYPTSYVALKTIERLEEFARTPDRPFLLKCSFPDPHHPFTPPGRYWDMYRAADVALPPSWHFDRGQAPPHLAWLLDERDAGTRLATTPALFACSEREAREAIALTYGMITMIDDAIGRILARLTALGLAADTVVIFTSDHGDFMGDHQLLLKGPLHYQSIIRVPFIWAEPAEPGGTRRRGAMAGTIDIAPTILERTGLAPFNGMHGASLTRVIRGEDERFRDAMVIEEEGQRVYMGFPKRVRARTLLTERYRLTVYDGVAWGELYDLVADPHELSNLWGEPSAQAPLRTMQDRLIRELIQIAETSPRPSALA